MKSLIIGSQALIRNLPGKRNRKPHDIDVIIDEESLDFLRTKYEVTDVEGREGVRFHIKTQAIKYELELANQVQSSAWMLDRTERLPKAKTILGESYIASIDMLATIKKSHLVLPTRWWKHVDDYALLKKNGAKILPELYQLRRKESLARSKRPSGYNMSLTNEDFFKRDNVQRFIPHDEIHKIVAYYETPMYHSIKHDKNLAKCDRDLFENLSYWDKVRCVREEMFVLTIERCILPRAHSGEPWIGGEVYFMRKTLAAMGTTVTSGWFRDFIHENAHNIIREHNYFIKKAHEVVSLVCP